MALDRLTPSQRVQQKQTVYDKTKNLEPAQETRQGQQMGQMRDKTTDAIAQSASQGGYKGRSDSNEMLGQTGLEIAGLAGQQAKEQDALSFQGANMKESIVGSRQLAASNSFARKNKQQEAALAEAVAQRAFDLGMEGKELIFHNNSLVADAGFEALQRDYTSGRVDRRTLLTIAKTEALNAQQLLLSSERMLAKRWGELLVGLQQEDIAAQMKNAIAALEAQKQAMLRATRASNVGAIVTGIVGVGVTAATGSPTIGTSVGGIAGGLTNAAY